MTKPKKLSPSALAQWQAIAKLCINLLITEPARTDGYGKRAKIQIKFRDGVVHEIKLPKFIFAQCDEEGYHVCEWRVVTLINWLNKIGISEYDAAAIYKQRMGAFHSLSRMYNELDIVLDKKVEEAHNGVLSGEDSGTS